MLCPNETNSELFYFYHFVQWSKMSWLSMFSFFIIVFATLFYCSFDFLIYFQCIILSFLIFRWIVILILFLPRSFSAVLLFSHVFSVSLFFSDSFYDKFFGRDIFTCCSFIHNDFCFFEFCLPDFLLVTYFTGFINKQYFTRQVILFGCKLWYWCWIVCCIIQFFVIIEVGVYFAFYHYLNLTLTIQHNFTLIQLLLFQPTWTENKQINLSTNKTNQPTYLPL